MNFLYNQKWEGKLLKLGLQRYITDLERVELDSLIKKAMYATDIRLIRPLIILLRNANHLLGQVQSIYSTLEYTDENSYYRSFFSVLPSMIDSNPNEILNCLAVHNINASNSSFVMNIVNVKLNYEEQTKITKLIEEYNCTKDIEYSFFYSQLPKGN